MIGSHTYGGYSIPVLYLDNHVLAAVKPRNMPSQSDRTGDADMLSAMKRYVALAYGKPGEAYLGLIHRLDRPVGGVMAFARTSKAAGRLSAAFAEGRVRKRYLAVARGDISDALELRDYLRKDGASGTVFVVPEGAEGGKLSLLTSTPIARALGTTLLEVIPVTGRPHQIRVQHANAGHPLWGDNRYGGGRAGERIALWAHGLSFEHPVRGELLSFTAPPPADQIWLEYSGALSEYMGFGA